MFDYRLFFANSTLDNSTRTRRPHLGHDAQRVYRLPAQPRAARQAGRR